MSFRPDTRNRSKVKFSVRDVRLYNQIAKKSSEKDQNAELEEHKVNSRTEVDNRVKKRVKKISLYKKRQNYDVLITNHSNKRWDISPENWEYLKKGVAKISSYPGFQQNPCPPVSKLEEDAEHEMRKVVCQICSKSIQSVDILKRSPNGSCTHFSCNL